MGTKENRVVILAQRARDHSNCAGCLARGWTCVSRRYHKYDLFSAPEQPLGLSPLTLPLHWKDLMVLK